MKYQWFRISHFSIYISVYVSVFWFNYEKVFAGKTVLIVGDLLQLPPVKLRFVLTPINGQLGDMFGL